MKNGCHNRAAYKTRVMVQDGWYMDGYTRLPRMIEVPFKMSNDCQYTKTELGKADKRCDGCKHRQ